MAIISDSLTDVKLRMACDDVARITQQCSEARTKLEACIVLFQNLGSKYQDLLDTFGQNGYATDANRTAMLAKWQSLLSEYGAVLGNANQTLAAFNATATLF